MPNYTTLAAAIARLRAEGIEVRDLFAFSMVQDAAQLTVDFEADMVESEQTREQSLRECFEGVSDDGDDWPAMVEAFADPAALAVRARDLANNNAEAFIAAAEAEAAAFAAQNPTNEG